MNKSETKPAKSWRHRLYETIEPLKGSSLSSQTYDNLMVVTVLLSFIPLAFHETNFWLDIIDVACAIVFIVDYILHWITADYVLKTKSKSAFFRYPFSPMAILDLLTIIPLLTAVNNSLRLLRIFRLLQSARLLHIIRLLRYSRSVHIIFKVFKKSQKTLITVAIFAVAYTFISALVIFNVEPETFPTFFDAFYWAVVSLTTLGYGDIYPVTIIGKIVTMFSAAFGVAVIALPAGTITAAYIDELNRRYRQEERKAREAEKLARETEEADEHQQLAKLEAEVDDLEARKH